MPKQNSSAKLGKIELNLAYYIVVRKFCVFKTQQPWSNATLWWIRYLLKDKCESAYDQLASLENIRQRLEHDLQDKTEALKIDSDQLGLTERSTGLSFKPDPLKVPNGSVQPDAWQDHSVQVSSNTSVFRFSKDR